MYKITVVTDGHTYPLYLPGSDDLQLIDPVLTQELNYSGNLAFEIPPGHPFRDKIQPLTSEFFVYQNGEEIFRGRNIGTEEDFYKRREIDCEGDLAYLLDSIQRPFDHTGSVEDFFTARLTDHNSQVEPRKQFKKGIVNVAAASVQRVADACETTLNCLKSQLIGSYKGYLRTRFHNGDRYLDYVIDYGGYNSQPIRFRENLLALNRKRDVTTLRTAIIPYGAMVEVANPDGTTSSKRVDITSVNGGKDYIFNQEAVNKYGWFTANVIFDEITDPEILKRTAEAYLEDVVQLPDTLELTAIDLSLVDADIASLKIGYWTRVVSEPHNLKGEYLLTKKVIHLTEPERDTIVLGGTIEGLTGSTSKDMKDINYRVQEIARQTKTELTDKINNATKLITGGLGGYVVLDVYDPDTGKQMHPWRILVMDTPDRNTARSVFQINKNGIGFSTTGINGPYRNAWTIDGNLVADFITAGSMLADRIRGGILEVGGAGLARNGRIVVKNKTDQQIGYWDDTGLHVLLGVIQGSEINASDINGSNIYGGSITGTTIDVGIFAADEVRADIGNFFVSDLNGRHVLQSRDGSVMLSEDASGVSTLFCVGGNEFDSVLRASAATRLVYAQDMYLYNTGYGTKWTVAECIKDLYDEINNLKNVR